MKTRSLRGATSITIATAVGQLITLAVLPILSRLYTPTQFGALSFVLSIAAILAPVATLRLDYALTLPRSRRIVRSLVTVVLATAGVTGLATATILAGLLRTALAHLHLSILDCVLAGLLVMLTAMQFLVVQLALRDKQFGHIAGRNVLHSAAISVGQLSLAPLKFVLGNGMILGSAIGTAVGVLSLVPRSREYLKPTSFLEMRMSVRKYWRFPVVFAPSSLLVFLSQQGPLLIVVMWFGAHDGGQMGMAERIVSAPLSVIGLSIGAVFRAHMAERIRSSGGGYRSLYIRTSALLGAMGLAVGVVVFFGAIWFLPIFFGAEWVLAGQIAQAMAITAGIRMMVNPTRSFVDLFQRARLSSLLEVSRLAMLGLGTAIFMAFNGDPVFAVWCMLLALSVSDVVTWLIGLRVTGAEDKRCNKASRSSVSVAVDDSQ